MELRPLGNSGMHVTPVALGCWPIAGMTSLGVNDADSLATIHACFDLGINHLDTAFCYGSEGESERLIARAVGQRRDEMVIATKGGIHWGPDRRQIQDARPQTLRRQCESSLKRLQTDRVELFYLHAPDPAVPVAESAGELKRLCDEGKIRAAGASNISVDQMEEFVSACPLSALQPPYNMLQRQIETTLLPWCRGRDVAVMVYWPLMKGLLAGRIPRDHVFAQGDGRAKYPMFRGEEWQKNQDFVDRLREVGRGCGRSVAEVVINWTIHQPGITSALCGAKQPAQIRETAGGAGWQLSPAQRRHIDVALADRGIAVVRRAV